MRKNNRWVRGVLAALLCAGAVAGCGGAPEEAPAAAEKHKEGDGHDHKEGEKH